ncbi:MAG: sigma-70 family RNA polymerase sigma factor [Verrucomicrobia subdivision 3 bacterium]|nr:sigma-70 family RNA polymerase sigma factor [Limisphaerales bacterium]
MTESQQLLAQYVQTGSEAAFQELVSRYVDLVYSVALRLVEGDTHRAEDVAQTVFVDLARMAHALSPNVMLGGWLHRHTCFVAGNTMRGERRRQSRERQAVEMNVLHDHSDADYLSIAPILDEAINQLNEADRTAILLRFFEQRDLRSVGESLGTNEDAARMRINRALEKLESLLKHRGVTTSAAVLAVTLSANAIQVAPIGLAVTISAAAFSATGIATAATATTKAIAMTTLQKALIGTTLVAAIGVGMYEARQASVARAQIGTLQRQQTSLTEQLARERDEAAGQLAALRDNRERLNRDTTELLKLRGEVTRLRADSQELARLKASNTNDQTLSEAVVWKNRVNQLKQYLEQSPTAKIPELQLVTEQDWLNAAKGNLNTEADYRRALSALRASAENKFITTLLQPALKEYGRANNGQFPADLSQLQPYFKSSVDAAILQRWEVAPAATVKALGMGGDVIITQKAPVDDLYDTRFGIGPNGFGSTDFLSSLTRDVLAPVNQAFAAANNGKFPEDLSQLLPYAVTPEQQAALQKLIQKRATDK